jgi:hypothetical protein
LPAGKKGWTALFIFTLLVPRLFALNLLPSDDVPRYIWEGRILLEGFNPYAVPPDDPRLESFRDETYPGINHKDMPAIYPPLTQYIFALLSRITRTTEGFRLFIGLVELLCLFVMFRWLRYLSLPRERLLIYALNPLVIIGIAGQGHLDALQILFLVLGLYLYARKREGSGMVLVTLAGLVKFLGFFALPFLIRRRTVKYVPLCAAVIFLSYLPFFFLEGAFSLGNLGVYLGRFEYYSLTFGPLRWLFGTKGAHAVTALILFTALISLWLTRTRPESSIPPFLFLLTLMGTTVHFWYLAPLLALSLVRYSRPLIGLSLLFMPYFDVLEKFHFQGIWEGAWWRPVATYVPFLILFWIELSGRWPAFGRRGASPGVVVPVLNDAHALGRLLVSLDQAGARKDRVVIADGGSTDGSRAVAEKWGARVVACARPGRGNQLREGAGHLETDLILILHADNIVEKPCFEALRKTAAAYPHAAGGAFRLKYARSGFKMRALSVLTNTKVGLFSLSFGDQGQWIRRGRTRMPAIPLMEDVELALRISDAGGGAWVPAAIRVSPRRYERKGVVPVLRRVISFTLGYLFTRRWRDRVPDTQQLYEKYYGKY